MADYDELALMREGALEYDPPFDLGPVRRVTLDVGSDRHLSALRWGTAPADVVLLHGGGQNAHTWDAVALALRRPLVAIDLPGHGHSDDVPEKTPLLTGYARDVAAAIHQFAPEARAVVGMSLGGLTAIMVGSIEPERMRRLVLVDILPDQDPAVVKRIAAFSEGPDSFEDFESIANRVLEFNPGRSAAAIRRAILFNAVQHEDGRWRWRHQDRRRLAMGSEDPDIVSMKQDLWRRLEALTVPIMLVHGLKSGSVVTPENVRRFKALQPTARIEEVPRAGHSIQSQQPFELARLLTDFLDTQMLR